MAVFETYIVKAVVYEEGSEGLYLRWTAWIPSHACTCRSEKDATLPRRAPGDKRSFSIFGYWVQHMSGDAKREGTPLRRSDIPRDARALTAPFCREIVYRVLLVTAATRSIKVCSPAVVAVCGSYAWYRFGAQQWALRNVAQTASLWKTRTTPFRAVWPSISST